MSIIKVKYAQLHNGLFLAGVNFGQKLNPQVKSGLKIEYSTDLQALVVEYNSQVSLVFNSNIADMCLEDATEIGYTVAQSTKKSRSYVTNPVTHVSHPIRSGIDAAQVGDPTRDVVESSGPGSTGQVFGK